MIHFYSHYVSPDPEENRRYQLAQQSWSTQDWEERPIADSDLPRLFVEGNRRLPYIRDLFDRACAGEGDDEKLVFTNSDIMVCSDCDVRAHFLLEQVEAFFSLRMEFYHRMVELVPDHNICRGVETGGTDLYGFRAGWWRKNRDRYPDMLLGRNFWDSCMNELIQKTCGEDITELPGISYHEHHEPFCMQPANRWSIPSQIYVWNLAKNWFISQGVDYQKKYGIPH